ncbi:MAG TPA: winged helix-turn-helix domain-containing protein, partial [Candidatus Limnocylindrales bacterium]|nr:winged helix-turn-helix domain-containing protein [Candidatus Limnocylindrales bacterium]
MDDRISVDVLGPLRIRRAGAPVDVSAAMPQRMLALLVARDGEAIQIDALAEAMWEGSPPRTARKTIQVYAHRLRRALGGEDRIEFTAGGYRLRTLPGEVD